MGPKPRRFCSYLIFRYSVQPYFDQISQLYPFSCKGQGSGEETSTTKLDAGQHNTEQPEVSDENSSESKPNFLSNFSNIVGKVANNATTVLKDKVTNSMIGEFNKTQDEFIKNKGMENL